MSERRCTSCDALMRPYAPEDWTECGICRDASKIADLETHCKELQAGKDELFNQLAAKTEECERLRGTNELYRTLGYDALVEDRERLEFLANNFGRIVQFALSPHWAVMWNQGDDETERFLDWRDAIDAAIAMHNSGGGDG